MCVLVYETAHIFKSQYDFLSGVAAQIQDTAVRIASAFVETMTDEEQLRALVFDKDLEGRDSLTLLSKYNITGIMNNRNMEKIALELWTSEYDVKSTFLECSSALRIVTCEATDTS